MTTTRTFDCLRVAALAVLPLGPVQSLPSSPSWSVEGGQAGAQLGIGVAPAGDVNGDGYGDVLVGAYLFDAGETDEGRAFLHLGSASGLATSPAWTVEGDQTGARLGASLALAGDVNGDGYSDVIVGAHLFDGGLGDEGRASVYLGSALGLATSPAWTVEGEQAGAELGYSVACAGDVNGDGFSDVLVGARAFDNGESDEGRAYLYLGSAAGLATTPAWTAEGNQAGAEFGAALSTAGDVNGDGFGDVLVGARGFDAGQANEGRVFLYLGSSTGLAASPAWTAESDQIGAAFGVRVATAGDVNGDGFGDVLVGAWLYDEGETDEGRAYLYLGSAAGLAPSAAWTAEGEQIDARFGAALDAAGDVNGDGFGDVIVGAFALDTFVPDSGRAFVYLGSAAGLAASAGWSTPQDFASASVGSAVSTAGDVNGDGYSDVLVGAFRFTSGEALEGRVAGYHGGPAFVSTVPGWSGESNRVGAHFGASVASAGDVNGDGYGDLVVGAPEYSNRGRAYLFPGTEGGLATSAAWVVEGSASFESFGRVVAPAGDVDGDGHGDLLVSLSRGVRLYRGGPAGLDTVPAWSVTGGDHYFGWSVAGAGDVNGDGYADVVYSHLSVFAVGGTAYLHYGSPTGPSPSPDWIVNGDRRFGISVASAGDVNGDGFGDVIVGDDRAENGEAEEGLAYVYLGSPAGPSLTPDWIGEGNLEGAWFGHCVASAGDVNGDGFSDVIVGAPRYTTPPFCSPTCRHEGRAFVFLGSPVGLASTPAWTGDEFDDQGEYGSSVASAGDVNADGFSDVLVGAPLFGTSPLQSGRAFLYLGSSAGTAQSPAWTKDGAHTAANLGDALASAGDVNGDGFGDFVVGSPQYGNGQSTEGGAFLFPGNRGSGGRVRALQQRTYDGVRPLALLDGTGASGLFRLRARFPGIVGAGWASPATPLAFLEWEVKPLGTPFDGQDLQRGPAVPLAVPGSVLLVLDEPAYLGRGPGHRADRRGGVYAWRARVRTNHPFFPRTAWFSQAGNAQTEAKVRAAEGRLR